MLFEDISCGFLMLRQKRRGTTTLLIIQECDDSYTALISGEKEKKKTLGGPNNSQYKNDVYKYNLALAERKANFGWNVYCKHSITKAAYSTD